MRILAYGGNEYSIRAMIGEWPGISIEHLGDLYGIPSGSPSFGLVFPGGAPALIYRERINPQYRGGYPYTVLLDLGSWQGADTIWTRAGWNAAGLLECMFGAQSPRRSLFMAPEQLTTAVLKAVVDEIIAKCELDRFAPESSELTAFEKKWASFLAGSLNSAVPVVAPPRSLGIERRPTMAELASLAFRLPLWLRAARGWMIGGSYTQAAGFGAGALFDDEPFGEKIDPSAVIRDGDQMQSLLQQLSESPSTAESARKLINEPAFNWPDSKQLFERARQWRLAAIGDDSAFQEKLPEDGMLAEQIFAAALENAREKARRQKKIGPDQTRAILQSRHRFGPTRIPRSMVHYFDVAALNRQLDVESVPPRVPEYLELPADLCLARCKSQMLAKKGDVKPAELDGWRQFLRDADSGDAETEFLEEFARQLRWLAPWKNSEDRKLTQVLEQEAASRLRKGPDSLFRTWLFDSATFLPAEKVNAELENFKDNLDAPLKDLAVFLKEEPRRMGTGVRAWLKQLASSGLRNHIGVEAKLEVAYESPQGWADFWALSQALKEGKPFAGKEVVKEERAFLAAECLDLLQLYTGNKQLRISVPEFVQIAKALELPKRFGSALSELASDSQFRRYYEALLPVRKKGPAEAQKPEPTAIAKFQLLTEASELRDAIDGIAKEIAESDLMIPSNSKQEIDSQQYDDLADLLLIDWARGKSSRPDSQELYVSPPVNPTAVATGTAALLLGGAAWFLRFHPATPVAGALRAVQHPLLLELAGTGLDLCGLVQLIRGLFPPAYTLTLSKNTWKRLRKVAANFLENGDRYTKGRCGELLKSFAQSGAREFNVEGSFDWLLLLYLGFGAGPITQFEDVSSNQLKRLRRSIVFVLDRAGLIRKKGWFRR
jgi:hypothetical protein